MQPSLLGFFWAFRNFAGSGKFSEEQCGFGLNEPVGGWVMARIPQYVHFWEATQVVMSHR
jgi:hypothetical protein